jgi:hypothetical protein
VSIIALTSDLKHKTFAEHLNLRINKAPGIECLIHFGEAHLHLVSVRQPNRAEQWLSASA